MSDEALARRLRRPHHGVEARRITLGIPKFQAQRRGWSAAEDALLGRLRDVEVARKLGRTVVSVQVRRFKLGIPKPDPPGQIVSGRQVLELHGVKFGLDTEHGFWSPTLG